MVLECGRRSKPGPSCGGEADASAGSGPPVRVHGGGRDEVGDVVAHPNVPPVVVDTVMMRTAQQDAVSDVSLI